MKSPPKARAKVTGKTDEVARQHHADAPARRPSSGSVSCFAWSTSSSSVLRRRLDAALLEQRLVVEQRPAWRGGTGTPTSLPSKRMACDEPGRDVGEVLDRRLGLIVVERLQQLRRARRRAAVDEEADAEIGPVQARLAQQAVLQRVGVEGRPGEVGVVAPSRQGLVRSPAGPVVRLVWWTRWHSTFSVLLGGPGRPRPSRGEDRRRGRGERLASCEVSRHGVASLDRC